MAMNKKPSLTKEELRAKKAAAAEAKYLEQREKEAAKYAQRKREADIMEAKIAELRKINPVKAAKQAERAQKKLSKINETAGDRIFNIITSTILILLTIVVGYPVLYVVSASFTDALALQKGALAFLPVDPTLDGYKFILEYKQVWIGYRNSIFYTFGGVVVTMACTILAAYPLSRKTFQFRGKYMAYFYLTTLFGAGLIPTFILQANYLGLYNTIWPILLCGAVAVSHIIILRTAFSSGIPGDLFDAAKIDGANDFQCLIKIALPLAKATISTLILYNIVGAWNEYFTSMLYLQDANLWPLQLVLKPIMTAAEMSASTEGMTSASQQMAQNGLDQVRYGLIVVGTVPPLVAYFIVQKQFKKGVMVGSVKG